MSHHPVARHAVPVIFPAPDVRSPPEAPTGNLLRGTHGSCGAAAAAPGLPAYVTSSSTQPGPIPSVCTTSASQFPSFTSPPMAKENDDANRAEPPPPGSSSLGQDPDQSLSDTPLPDELKRMMSAEKCELCAANFTSEMQANIHYDSGHHRRKMRFYMIDYCRLNMLPLPAAFRPKPENAEEDKNEEKQQRRMEKYCKICNQTFPTTLHAQQHYMGRNHVRRLDGKPTLKPGYYNKLTGKWQRKPPSENDFQPKLGWWTTEARRVASSAADKDDDDVVITNGGGESSRRHRRRQPLSSLGAAMDDVIIIPGYPESGAGKRTRKPR